MAFIYRNIASILVSFLFAIFLFAAMSCGGSDNGDGNNNPSDAEAPVVPQNLTAEATSSSVIRLTWDASTDNIGVEGYYVYRNGGSSPVATTTGTTFSDSGLSASTEYTYTVSAFDEAGNQSSQSTPASETTKTVTTGASIIFLHHSTGGVIWGGGVSGWFDEYNSENSTSYTIEERAYPDGASYPWDNYPYDYWNIWVNHAGDNQYSGQDTLEILTTTYDVIIWKHCFPVSNIAEDTGSPDITSSDKTVENYKLQYNALKEKMHSFPDTKFIVWTGAANVQASTSEAQATRARAFFDWVRDEWDEEDDNIFVWDFWQLETEGGLYLKANYSAGDSHPSSAFAAIVAPYFCTRIVDVIQGNGDTGSITGH